MKLTTMHYVGLAVAALAIVYLLYTMSGSTLNPVTKSSEGFEDYEGGDDYEGFEDAPADAMKPANGKNTPADASKSAPAQAGSGMMAPSPDAPTHTGAVPPAADKEGFYGGFDRTVSSYAAAGDATGRAAVPSSDYANCYTRDGLNPADLLPAPSSEASQFLASNPPTQGSPDGRNLLQAGHHIGVDTVCQTNKNPNLQLRSDPPIARCGPQPIFNSSSIPATQNNRRVLEIGAELNPGCEASA
jgi:hypothetical protein